MQPPKTSADDYSLDAYDYELPQENIAQHPASRRDASKLLVVTEGEESPRHCNFSDIIDYFRQGDILVLNNTKVFPARLLGKKETGGKAEVFLLGLPREIAACRTTGHNQSEASALIKSSKRPGVGSKIIIADDLVCTVTDCLENGKARITLSYPSVKGLPEILEKAGAIPLPPYISRDHGTTEEDRNRYQTVYAAATGAVAAPTAGLHFTAELLSQLREKGVEIAPLTLHVGYGTFAPVRCEKITDHQIHSEYVEVSQETAARINQVKQRGGRVWAVGTTTVRALEFAIDPAGKVKETAGWCDLYIYPGFTFKVIDNLITNFHLPKSSLLFLVSALCGRENLLRYYREAIAHGYRFYSYGDAMALVLQK